MKSYFKKSLGISSFLLVVLSTNVSVSGEGMAQKKTTGQMINNKTQTQGNLNKEEVNKEKALESSVLDKSRSAKNQSRTNNTNNKAQTQGNLNKEEVNKEKALESSVLDKSKSTKNQSRTNNTNNKAQDNKKITDNSLNKMSESKTTQAKLESSGSEGKIGISAKTSQDVPEKPDDIGDAQRDGNPKNVEEEPQNEEEHSNGAFDFIKSSASRSSWIGDGKIFLYVGIFLMSMSVLGITLILMPKRKMNRKSR